MGMNFSAIRIAWLWSLSEEELKKHLRGERPFSDDEAGKFLKTLAVTSQQNTTSEKANSPSARSPT